MFTYTPVCTYLIIGHRPVVRAPVSQACLAQFMTAASFHYYLLVPQNIKHVVLFPTELKADMCSQLSIACSMEKQREPGTYSQVHEVKIERMVERV